MDGVKYTESDIYVRDQLLIQFMCSSFDERLTIEEYYDRWLKWLKEMEERHAERSKI